MGNLQLIYVMLAALIGALMAMFMQGGKTWKQMLITGVIAAMGFAVGYKIAGTVFGVIDIFMSVLGGYALNAGVSVIRQRLAIGRQNNMLDKFKTLYPDWRNRMNQPK